MRSPAKEPVRVNMPACAVVPPVKVFVPDNICVPLPVLMREETLEGKSWIFPAKVAVTEASVLIVRGGLDWAVLVLSPLSAPIVKLSEEESI